MNNGSEKHNQRSKITIFPFLLAGFLLSFFLFFFLPTFCNSQHEMLMPVKYVPSMKPIGNDFKMVLDSCRQLINHQGPNGPGTPQTVAFITPLGFLFFVPFLLADFFFAYKIYIVLLLLVYLGFMGYLPYRMRGERSVSNMVLLFLITGLASYGLQFEVERGQGSLFAVEFCLIGIYLFHYKPRLTPLAYACLIMGTQLKIVPGIFILMFVRDWRDWRGNLKRFALIGACNLALLFIFGFDVFGAFLRTVQLTSAKPYYWIGNHSIKGFTAMVKDWPWHYQFEWLLNYTWLTQKILLGIFMLCLAAVIYLSWRRRLTGFNPFLLVICVVGMMLIPAESMDYRLSALGPCVLIFLVALEAQYGGALRGRGTLRALTAALLLFGIAFAYSSTLYSYTLKMPEVYDQMNAGLIFCWLTANMAPALLTLTVLTTALMFVVVGWKAGAASEQPGSVETTATENTSPAMRAKTRVSR